MVPSTTGAGPREQSNAPLMNSVSPVKTARPVSSSMKKQMLSCVWHGVCTPRTAMPPS